MKHLFLVKFFAFLVLLTSCSKENEPAQIESQVLLNTPYGADARQNMDIYLPADRSTASTKTLILIHGGGWTIGDKTDINQFVDTLKRRMPSTAIFNINYRLSAAPANVFPTQELDVKSAVEFIYHHRNEYLISDKFIIVGASAGAHLAMLQAYKYDSPVKAKAVVSFFGPSDLTDMYYNPVGGNTAISDGLALAVGKAPAQDPALYINSSPVTFITSTSAMPTILLHGGLDPLVSPNQSQFVFDKLTLAGIISQYVFYPDGGHGDWDDVKYHDAFNKIQSFLELHVP
jgi:acetyl esterase/lipase